jgi:hypothetical protein
VTVDNLMLNELLLKLPNQREAVAVAIEQHGISECRAYRSTGLARSTKWRKLTALTEGVIALGTGASLLRMEGLTVNHIALTDSTVSSGWRGVGANADADAIGRG